MNKDELMKTAKAMVAPGKGILAADESSGTIKKRFDSILVESTEENRRFYRELLFTTPGMEEFISGVILYDETIRQKSKDGTSLPDVLVKKGVLPGIKVDKGAKMLAGSDQEKVTEGLDGLRERFIEYYTLGARFSKWRAVITIGDGIPTDYCISVNAHALARFAALSQEANIVPIVEPEVLMDADNTIEICEQVTEKTLLAVFDELKKQRVFIEGIILKPNMVISGKKCSTQATSKQIAESTLRCFKKVLPKELPGVVFLSGGQSEVEATVNLNEMNKTAPHPWELSFSYGRALQQSALKTWSGKPENAKAAQDAFFKRAKFNGLARLGNYKSEMEKLNH
ncbi:fructose-bisphosphate aldolase [Candidatus Roizmanbacteria bacterium RIFCSPLOWO2_02_FULL_38_10]|uniref:Fructose-bisphosphate aldolase n=1 Tax=Candidatus Roizmanbacteria bacterium RIFCSPLOWO2_02_FULL_38_10 TaxID=1802074 RepID=A0A1F7JKT8_9BACT|nr:MAG: fructose-bisphosphate aldolase [Candidatus Roizmanbacteria bacterium RIFCSPLOWO2_02_FULL_38_10]